MAKHIIQNEYLTVCVDSLGAELQSIVKNDTKQEYLWNGDATYWVRRAPILFPVVGCLKNKQYLYDDKLYSMTQHGFARDMEFELVEYTNTTLSYRLVSNEQTLENYPFQFELQIKYILTATQISVQWEVFNIDTKTIYFSIGAHPGFLCPLNDGHTQSQHYLSFDCELLHVTTIDSDGLARNEKYTIALDNGLLPISEHLFDDDALVIENDQAHKVSLLTPNRTPYVTLSFDAPLFGIWSPAKKQAPFVCIEPWYGRCDASDFQGELKDRVWGNVLDQGQTFHKSYTIHIH